VIPAATLTEFLAEAVARYGGLRRAAARIDIPYSTLRGWLHGRYGNVGDRGHAFLDALAATRNDLNATSKRLDALEQMLGCESEPRDLLRGKTSESSQF
jgi:hypothetical protein